MNRHVNVAVVIALTAPWLLACSPDGKSTGKTASTNHPSTTQSTNLGSNPLNAPADYLGAMGKAKNLAQKTVDLTTLNRAVQMFYAAEDRMPKDLKELVTQGYLPKLPEVPQGTRLAFNPATGEVRLVQIPTQ